MKYLKLVIFLFTTSLWAQSLDSIQVFPADAQPPAELRFPKLQGHPETARQYVFKVITATPKLTFEVLADPVGVEDRTILIKDSRGKEINRFAFKTGQSASFEMMNVPPGIYTAHLAEFGAEQLTVLGGNTFGAARAFNEYGGFNSFHTDKETKYYFFVPAGTSSLRVNLLDGAIALGFKNGDKIADLRGRRTKAWAELPEEMSTPEKAERTNQIKAYEPKEITFAPSDQPRIAYVEWLPFAKGGVGGYSTAMVIEGITLYSPDFSYVLFEEPKKQVVTSRPEEAVKVATIEEEETLPLPPREQAPIKGTPFKKKKRTQ